MTRLPLAVSLAASVALSACSGGGAASPTRGAADVPAASERVMREPTFDELALQNQLHLRHDRNYGALRLAKPNLDAMLPTKGMGSYTGTMALAVDGDLYSGAASNDFTPDTADLVANLALNVDFDTTKVEGALWDFVGEDGFKQDGSVQLRGLRKSGKMEVAGSGTLYSQTGETSDLSVDFDARFYGKDNAMIRGNVTGEISRDGTVAALSGDVVGDGKTY